MRDFDRRGRNFVMCKPGTDNFERLRVRRDELCDLLLGQMLAISTYTYE